MISFVITDAEWDALREERPDVFKVYCAIRRVMDYGTGIAGISYRINETMLRETISVPSIQGRHKSFRPSRQQARQPVQRLISLGLLVPRGPLVFELPYATSDKSVSKKSNRRATNEQPDEQPKKNHKKQNSYAIAATIGESDEVLMSNPPPIPGNPVKLKDTPPIGSPPADAGGTNSDAPASPSPPQGNGSRSTERRTVKGTRLPDDWTLPDDWRRWAATERPGLDIGLESAKFRDYWVAKTGQAATKRDWFATWRNWVRNARPPAKANGRGNGGYHESRQRIVDYLYDFSDDDDEPMQGRSLQ